MSTKIAPIPINLSRALAKIEAAASPEELRPLQADLDGLEAAMEATGRFTPDQLRKANEVRMRAIWKLGKLLAKVERNVTGRPSKKSSESATTFKSFLASLKPPLPKDAAVAYQRIGAMPPQELEKAIAAAHKIAERIYITELLHRARPYWYQESRKGRHQTIAATAAAVPGHIGPFPLIYADPPWKFEVYSEKGLDRTPDQHYPTLTDDEIKNFEIAGKRIEELAHRDAALLLWCTSSNLERALEIMRAWGFTYKTHAVWDKQQGGTGLVFRNWHEPLLYGTRGNMPGPQYQPPSIFRFPRGRHSAKPSEIRTEIEKMYPDFDEQTRAELFAREQIPGWTCYGFEAHKQSAEAAE